MRTVATEELEKTDLTALFQIFHLRKVVKSAQTLISTSLNGAISLIMLKEVMVLILLLTRLAELKLTQKFFNQFQEKTFYKSVTQNAVNALNQPMNK